MLKLPSVEKNLINSKLAVFLKILVTNLSLLRVVNLSFKKIIDLPLDHESSLT